MEELLVKGADELGIVLSEEQIEMFVQFYRILLAGNELCNLTNITEMFEVVTKHYLDSLTCMKAVSFDGEISLLDVGSGAGFPGIPLKILCQDLKVVLIESVNKKVNFMNDAILQIGLRNISALHFRAEELGNNFKYREKYNRVTARAVAQLNVLAEYCIPLLKVGGFFVAMKGPSAEEEINQAMPAIKILGAELESVITLKLPLSGEGRTLIAIRKISKTSSFYPRGVGIPTKKPLS